MAPESSGWQTRTRTHTRQKGTEENGSDTWARNGGYSEAVLGVRTAALWWAGAAIEVSGQYSGGIEAGAEGVTCMAV